MEKYLNKEFLMQHKKKIMQIGAVVFSNEYGLLGKTEQADELLLKITADVSSEK